MMSAIASFSNVPSVHPQFAVQVSDLTPTIAPRKVVHPQSRLDPKPGTLGRPTLDGAVRPHLHPTARFEARQVFHPAATAKRPTTKTNQKENSTVLDLTDDELPPSTAKVYDGRAKLYPQTSSSSIDLFL